MDKASALGGAGVCEVETSGIPRSNRRNIGMNRDGFNRATSYPKSACSLSRQWSGLSGWTIMQTNERDGGADEEETAANRAASRNRMSNDKIEKLLAPIRAHPVHNLWHPAHLGPRWSELRPEDLRLKVEFHVFRTLPPVFSSPSGQGHRQGQASLRAAAHLPFAGQAMELPLADFRTDGEGPRVPLA